MVTNRVVERGGRMGGVSGGGGRGKRRQGALLGARCVFLRLSSFSRAS